MEMTIAERNRLIKNDIRQARALLMASKATNTEKKRIDDLLRAVIRRVENVYEVCDVP